MIGNGAQLFPISLLCFIMCFTIFHKNQIMEAISKKKKKMLMNTEISIQSESEAPFKIFIYLTPTHLSDCYVTVLLVDKRLTVV